MSPNSPSTEQEGRAISSAGRHSVINQETDARTDYSIGRTHLGRSTRVDLELGPPEIKFPARDEHKVY